MIKCKKCGYEHINESEVDLHHIVPKWIGGRDIDGRIYLCKENKGNDCHRQLHKHLYEKLRVLIKNITDIWIKE